MTRHLENVLKTLLQDVSKKSWKSLEDVLARRLEDIFRTSWKRVEDVLKTYGLDEYIGLDQDVFWSRMTKVNIFVLIKTSPRCLLKTKTKDFFIRTNVCWEGLLSHCKMCSCIKLSLDGFVFLKVRGVSPIP